MRGRRGVFLIASCAAAALLFCACAAAPKEDAPSPEPVFIKPSAAPESVEIPPLVITRGLTSDAEGIMLYPRIEGENADRINTSIENDVKALANRTDAQVFTTYRITNNSGGLFSAVVEVKDLETSELINVLSLNYDAQTGQKLGIADCFDAENDKWRRVLPDIVTLQAQAKGLTLLCDVMPIGDGQLYYISGNELVLLYRQYEITTYADPVPQFSIPVSALSEFLTDSGPLTRLVGAKPADGEVVAPTPVETSAAAAKTEPGTASKGGN